LVDLARIHIVATDDDHLFLTVDKEHVTILVVVADVAGIEPAVADLPGVLFRAIAIAGGELRPAHADFAAFAGGHDARAGFEIHHFGLIAGGRDTDGADLAGAMQRILMDRRALRHAPALEQDRAGGVFPEPDQFHRTGGAAGQTDP